MAALNGAELLAEFPIGEAFLAYGRDLSRDELHRRQNAMFRRCVARAWTIPFYQRLWGAAGAQPGDIQSLDDLPRLPVFDKSDLMASIERAPPFGDFHGRDAYPEAERPPIIIHTTSGTTGNPQIVPFGPRGREVQNLLLARAYRLHGMADTDIVHSVYGHGLINGGHYIREAVTHWTGATFIPAGTGIETRSARQVELMRSFGATVIVGFVDYIKRLAAVAQEAGIIPGRDVKIRMICGHIGQEDRAALSESWGGCEIFDWYGVADTGTIASEGPDHDGLYVMEDAQLLEVGKIDTHAPVEDCEVGDMIVTTLYKDDIYPMIRFNTHDVTRWRAGRSSLGLNLRRIDGFLGRSDNMVKLRGINVFPTAVGSMLPVSADLTGEYICRAERDETDRDTLVVAVEVHGDTTDAALAESIRNTLRQKLGIDVVIELTPAGSLSALTQVDMRQKPIRLIDARHKPFPTSA
ncbi:MAG: phenylacetate--CoA ligase family protein [Bacteroidota bacterium]|jgi:phenylacetate-CoA ligase